MNISVFGAQFDLDESLLAASDETVRQQIAEYERGERRTFDLGVTFPDEFAGRVMRAMAAIPYGETRTYGQLAANVESAPVAVGGACGRNPLPVVVPCHRVVGAESLGGYSADGGTETKRRLLEHEDGAGIQQRLEGRW